MLRTKLSRIPAKRIIKKGIAALDKNSHVVTAVLGVGCFLFTIYEVAEETPIALQRLEEAKQKKGEELTVKEKIVVAGPVYAPAILTGTAAVAFTAASPILASKKLATASAAYNLLKASSDEFQHYISKNLDAEKVSELKEKYIQEKMESNPPDEDLIQAAICENKMLCYDSVFGRYFMSSEDDIIKAQNVLNRRLFTEMWVTVNDFYFELGVKPMDIGDDLGWNVEDEMLDFDIHKYGVAANGQPCLVVTYNIGPRYDYRNLH